MNGGTEMDVREKLIELLTNSQQLDVLDWATGWEETANYLIANGVTVQEWISVDDRLPRTNVGVLVYTPRLKNIFEAFYRVDGKWEIFSYRGGEILNDKVTHWMPIPQPPKGE